MFDAGTVALLCVLALLSGLGIGAWLAMGRAVSDE